jgi:hypothetical protein
VEESATEGGDACSLDAEDDAAEAAVETETTVEATPEVAGNGGEDDDDGMEEEVTREFVYDEVWTVAVSVLLCVWCGNSGIQRSFLFSPLCDRRA